MSGHNTKLPIRGEQDLQLPEHTNSTDRSRSPSPSMFDSLKKKLSRKGHNPLNNPAISPSTASRSAIKGMTPPSGLLATPQQGGRSSAQPSGGGPPPVGNEPPPAYTPSPARSNIRSASPAPSSASTADDQYAFLKSFDTVFLVDDSGSMAGRSWRETQKALETITPICTQRDADGIDIYFLNHPDSNYYHNVKLPGTIIEIFQNVRPGGGTPTGQKLNKILKPYLQKYEQKPDSTKPINVIVITDGEPSDDVESVIINAAKKLDKLDAPAWQVGIQFFQVGKEPGAREHLKQLDDGLADLAGGELRDIVDTVPFKEMTMLSLAQQVS